jgi:class 3 adenylate cyclase
MRGFETRDALLKRSLARAQVAPRQIDLGDDEEMADMDAASDSGNDLRDLREAAGEDNESEHQPLLLEDDDVLRIENPGDEKELYTFSMVKLTFDDPKVETQYVNRIIKSQLSREVFILFAMMAIFVLCGHVGTGCMHTTSDRLLPMVVLSVLITHLAYLHYIGTNHRYNFAIVEITYSIFPWLALLIYQPGCGLPDEIHAGGNVIAMYFFLLVLLPSLSMEITMHLRLLFLTINAGQFAAGIAVRRAIYRDDVLVWEFLPPAFVLAFTFMSLFSDFTMRSGFQSTMRRRALQTNRSEYAEQTSEALEMMLPFFVIDRLLRAARRGHVVEISDTSSQASGASSAATGLSAMSALSVGSASSSTINGGSSKMITGDVAQAMLMRRSETVWPYPRAVVMFVSFEPSVMAYDTISDTVMRIESVARGRSIQKVKTMGTTVVLVAGIDKSLQFEDAVVNCVEAALEIQRRVFPMHLTEGWKHRIGMHCGPIFGAVIGSQSLAFDVYGDTVNTASVMESSAPNNSVRCTAAVRQALPLDEAELDFSVESIGMPLVMKGKGSLQVFHIQERERHRVGPVAQTAGHHHHHPHTPHSESTSEPSDPSAYAESIRSSIRSQGMLPDVAPAAGNFAFGTPKVTGRPLEADSPLVAHAALARRQQQQSSDSVLGASAVPPMPGVNSEHTAHYAPSAASQGINSTATTKHISERSDDLGSDDDDPLGTAMERMKKQVFDDDIAGFSDEDD